MLAGDEVRDEERPRDGIIQGESRALLGNLRGRRNARGETFVRFRPRFVLGGG